jgi:hypothetical protein
MLFLAGYICCLSSTGEHRIPKHIHASSTDMIRCVNTATSYCHWNVFKILNGTQSRQYLFPQYVFIMPDSLESFIPPIRSFRADAHVTSARA